MDITSAIMDQELGRSAFTVERLTYIRTALKNVRSLFSEILTFNVRASTNTDNGDGKGMGSLFCLRNTEHPKTADPAKGNLTEFQVMLGRHLDMVAVLLSFPSFFPGRLIIISLILIHSPVRCFQE
jgi:hypothetical protein